MLSKSITRFKNIISNREYRVIISNSLYLVLIKGATFIIPLLIIPYLLDVIGSENYGRYVLAFSIIQYFLIFVDYGFQFTGTKSIALIGDDKEKLSRIFSAIFFSKMLLAVFSSLLLLLLGLIIKVDFYLYIFGTGIIIGQAFLPLWLFLGKEKMHFVTVVSIIPKIMSLVLIFVFVKSEADYILLTLFDSIGYLLSGIIGFGLAIKVFKVKLQIVKYAEIKEQLIDGWQVFMSTVMIAFYRQANVIILSFFGNFTLVGYYSVAERIIKAIQSISTPITQAIFPYFSRKLNNELEKQKNTLQFLKWGRLFTLGFLFLSIVVMILSKLIIQLYLGNAYNQVSINLVILSPVILLGFMNYYYGIIGFVNMGYQKYFNRAILVAALSNVILCFVLSYFFKDIGASISLLIAEAVLFSILIYYFKKLESINIIKI